MIHSQSHLSSASSNATYELSEAFLWDYFCAVTILSWLRIPAAEREPWSEYWSRAVQRYSGSSEANITHHLVPREIQESALAMTFINNPAYWPRAATTSAAVSEEVASAAAAATTTEKEEVSAHSSAEQKACVVSTSEAGSAHDNWEEQEEWDASMDKYWAVRYTLFSRFDEGIRLDRESWYSVSPEQSAVQVAERIVGVMGPGALVVDAMCGAGGNAIQLALAGAIVLGVDLHGPRLRLARHNARIYGACSALELLQADFMLQAPMLRADAVFLSPPWGGPEYARLPRYDLQRMRPDGRELFRRALMISPNIAFYVPRNVNRAQLLALAREAGLPCEIHENWYRGRLRTITAYYGALVTSPITHASDS